MAPSTKKRKEPPPNRTLTDFFSGADAIKRARVKPSQQLASASSVREIIVIDSDSEGGVPEEEGSGLRRGVYSQDKDTFGMPSELLRSSTPRLQAPSGTSQHSLIISEPDRSRFMFGDSAPLLEQPCIDNEPTEWSRCELIVRENASAVAGNDLASDPVYGLPIGDWAVADDELPPLEATDNDAETVGGEEEPSDEHYLCPVCGTSLIGIPVDVQTHVNQCLDENSQTNNLSRQGYTSVAVSLKTDVTPDNVSRSTLLKDQRGDLFTVLMKSRKENDLWVEVDAVVHSDFGSTRGNRRRAPFYKVLQGMPIAVDAFCYGAIPGVTAYFLTHAHSDHYTTLGSKWSNGPIYCSEETANLISHMLAVDPRWIRPLSLDTPTVVPNTGGVSVTLIEANHCPGSCLFLFEGTQTTNAGDSEFKSPFIGSSKIFRYLHCGDFRASPRHILHPAVNGKHIDHIYLDTTYLDSKYTFSPQPLVISACAELTRRLVMGGPAHNPGVDGNQNFTLDTWVRSQTFAERGGQQMPRERILVIVGTYSIGKERIVKGRAVDHAVGTRVEGKNNTQAIAQALGTKIYCDPRKTAIILCQADRELHALLTADPAEAGVHMLPLGTVTADSLKIYLRRFKGVFSRIIGFRPTGWTYSPPPDSDCANTSIRSIIARGQSRQFSYTDLKPSQKSSYEVQIFGVPYSEHSSFFELTCFAMSCDWGRMIPTVNVGSPASRAKMTKWLKRWESEKQCSKAYTIQPRSVDYW